MTGVATDVQVAEVAALLASPDIVAAVAMTGDGPAVFAPNQAWQDVYPRVTVETPQVLPAPGDGVCGQGSTVYGTVHVWTQGPSATLAAGDLSDLVRQALSAPLPLAGGRRVSAFAFVSANPVGDPDPMIEHVVCTFRYSVRQTA